MLKLIDISKKYKNGKNETLVLDKINLDFKKNELVFILGKSGSGKSTLLNIIGGILEPDSGRVLVDDKDITEFNQKMLCNYRNNMIGYIFQDYHLIEHMSVIDNIKLGQTIFNNNNQCEELLWKLEIQNKRKTRVNKLSGGEKQRVAIARALINDPDIILCDEPTGALDSVNSIKIMNILKRISKNKLVIVVSHDNILAEKYADRIINISDGKVDYLPQIDHQRFKDIVKKKISIFSLIKLAIKNLNLKKGRTIFTSLAISIGFLTMLIVLCLSKSFKDDISRLEKDIVSIFPITVYNGEFLVIDKEINKSDNMIINKNKDDYIHTNKINNKYLNYLRNIDEINYISYEYDISLPLITDSFKFLDNSYMKMIPNIEHIDNNYEILYGNNIKEMDDIVIKIDSNNNVDSELLNTFNIDRDIEYQELIGRKIKIISNDSYYIKQDDYYFINSDNEDLYKNSEIELEIVGIVREKEITDDKSYFYYNKDLIDYILSINSKSDIVKDQLNKDYNILGVKMDKDSLLSYLGYKTLPSEIFIYVSSIEDKDKVITKLDKYNDNNKNNELIYVDTMKETIDVLKDVINVITIVLMIFSLISILVSSLMIFILTNNRVMERIKEIGILRSLGARRKDVTRLFNIENLIIGIISSIMGIVSIIILCKPINSLLGILMDDDKLFKIDSRLVIMGLIFNICIVVISGYIPSKMASRKKIVDCINNRF